MKNKNKYVYNCKGYRQQKRKFKTKFIFMIVMAIIGVYGVNFTLNWCIATVEDISWGENIAYVSVANATENDVLSPSLDETILQMVEQAGLNPYEAYVIIQCESKWDSNAVGVNKNGSYDMGLWQINSIHKDILNSDKLNPVKATEWAINKRLKDGNWSAWTCANKLGI